MSLWPVNIKILHWLMRTKWWFYRVIFMIYLENVWKLFPLVGDFYVLRTLLDTTSVKICSKMLFSGIIFSKISGNFKFIGIGFIRLLFIYLIFFLFCLWRWTQLHTIGFKTYLDRIYIIALFESKSLDKAIKTQKKSCI